MNFEPNLKLNISYIEEDYSLPIEGETIRNSHYISIVLATRLKMSLNISETKIQSLKIGDNATIKVPALDNKEYDGYITKISNIAKNGKFTVEVEFHNDGKIKLGMSGEIEI